jgi:TPR repeat protein
MVDVTILWGLSWWLPTASGGQQTMDVGKGNAVHPAGVFFLSVYRLGLTVTYLEYDVSEQDSGLDMDLSSGIAAFEAKFFARAAGLLSPLAEQGNPEAQYRMAIMAQNGLGMHSSEKLAFGFMKAAAEAGHALAQHGLAFMYMEGECTGKDGALAVEWFRKAAEQGLVGSQTTLAMMYEQGNGVPQDLDEARKWYKAAGFEDR